MDAATITAAALEALDEVGLDKLTMRTVAARLGVQVGGLYYYLPDKSALLQSMANEICRHALADFEHAERSDRAWEDAAVALCEAVRAAVTERRDAARVLAAGPLNGSVEALALMERLIAVLDAGIAPRRANVAADTLMSYVTGFVLQEQIEVGRAGLPAPEATLRERFPRVFRGVASDSDDDAMFRAAVTAIVDGFRQGH